MCVNNVKPGCDSAQIAPTGTTCDQYVKGNAVDFSDYYAAQGGVIQYSTKNNTISATNPGVFFYYTGLSATITSAGQVFIDQADNNDSIGPFVPLKNNVQLWLVNDSTDTCSKVQLAANSVTISDGDVSVTIPQNAPEGFFYVISVKYETGSVKTQNAVTNPTVKFTFQTDVGHDGSYEETDIKGITLAPKFARRLI